MATPGGRGKVIRALENGGKLKRSGHGFYGPTAHRNHIGGFCGGTRISQLYRRRLPPRSRSFRPQEMPVTRSPPTDDTNSSATAGRTKSHTTKDLGSSCTIPIDISRSHSLTPTEARQNVVGESQTIVGQTVPIVNSVRVEKIELNNASMAEAPPIRCFGPLTLEPEQLLQARVHLGSFLSSGPSPSRQCRPARHTA